MRKVLIDVHSYVMMALSCDRDENRRVFVVAFKLEQNIQFDTQNYIIHTLF